MSLLVYDKVINQIGHNIGLNDLNYKLWRKNNTTQYLTNHINQYTTNYVYAWKTSSDDIWTSVNSLWYLPYISLTPSNYGVGYPIKLGINQMNIQMVTPACPKGYRIVNYNEVTRAGGGVPNAGGVYNWTADAVNSTSYNWYSPTDGYRNPPDRTTYAICVRGNGL